MERLGNMKKGMVHRHLMAMDTEKWMNELIDKRYEGIAEYQSVTTTVTTTSVVFKNGTKGLIRKKKGGKKTTTA